VPVRWWALGDGRLYLQLLPVKRVYIVGGIGLAAAVALGVGLASRAKTHPQPGHGERAGAGVASAVPAMEQEVVLAEATPPQRAATAPVEEPVVVPALTTPTPPSQFAHLEAKYAGAELPDLASARREIENEIHKISVEVLDEYFRTGAVETKIVPAGESWSPGQRPYAWAEQVRGSTQPDGTQHMQIAGFSQQQEPRTAKMFEEMVWLGEQLRQAGALGLLESPASSPKQR